MIEFVATLIKEIRDDLGLTRGVSPRIEKVIEHEDGSLHIITSDRSEKSLLLGPRGRICAELAKRISRKVTVYGQDELILRSHRLKLTSDRIKEVYEHSSKEQRYFLDFLASIISSERMYPEKSSPQIKMPQKKLKIALAYSGGIDSSAATYILKKNGVEPDAITVQMGREFYTPDEMRNFSEWCDANGVSQSLIKPIHDTGQIIQATKEGRIHPCGQCHEIIHESVKKFAKENQYTIIVTGELLPSGLQSIVHEDNLLIVHLPGALAWTKYKTEILAKQSGKRLGRKRFGCRLVATSNTKGWRNVGPSIFRILRELEAGLLTTGQGLDYIKDIVRPWIDERR